MLNTGKKESLGNYICVSSARLIIGPQKDSGKGLVNYDVELSDAWSARAKNKTTNVIRGWSFDHCIAIMRKQRSWEKDIEGFKEQSSRPVGRDKQKKLDAAAKNWMPF